METTADEYAPRLPNFIDGNLVEVGDGIDEVFDPSDGSVLRQVPRATAGDTGRAVLAADRAFATWGRTTPAGRADRLLAVARVIEEAGPDLAALESQNVGMPITFAEATIEASVDTLRFFAGAARTLPGLPTGEYVTGMTSFLRREPLGVVAQLLPWNVPLLMAAWKIGPALAAGNTVVVKPSHRTPVSLLRLCERLRDVLPPGVVNVVTGSHEAVGATLATHPRVRMVVLTGSIAAGAVVARAAAPLGKRLHLELGGKTPILVCGDAEIDLAARVIARAGLNNAGQDCTAASRVLAVASVYPAIVDGLARRLAAVRIGPPSDRSTEMGPLVSSDRREAVLTHVNGALAAGARLMTGGHALPGTGFFMQPTLLADVDLSHDIAHREVFGPVITVERVNDEDEAVQRANDAAYGLAAGIWTRSMSKGLRIAAALQAGKVWINEHHRDVTEMPHGGVKASGHGSDLSMLALEAYTAAKAVHVAWTEDAMTSHG